jgi:hypothetical protein
MLCGSFVTMALSVLRKLKKKSCSFDVHRYTEQAVWTTDLELRWYAGVEPRVKQWLATNKIVCITYTVLLNTNNTLFRLLV